MVDWQWTESRPNETSKWYTKSQQSLGKLFLETYVKDENYGSEINHVKIDDGVAEVERS